MPLGPGQPRETHIPVFISDIKMYVSTHFTTNVVCQTLDTLRMEMKPGRSIQLAENGPSRVRKSGAFTSVALKDGRGYHMSVGRQVYSTGACMFTTPHASG